MINRRGLLKFMGLAPAAVAVGSRIRPAKAAHVQNVNVPFQSNSPALLNEAGSCTNPTWIPNRSDTHTGLGWSNMDRVHLMSNSGHNNQGVKP